MEGVLGECSEEKTKLADRGKQHRLHFMNRHNVKCGKGTAMTGWTLRRSKNGKKYQIKYNCCKLTVKPGNCEFVKTKKNDWGEGKTIYLDRHNAKCGKDQFMKKWKIKRPGGKKKIYIKSRCCKAPMLPEGPMGIMLP